MKIAKAKKTVKIMGFEISATSDYVPLAELAALYLVMKAREGDPLAVEIMTAFNKEIKDANGKVIFSPKGTE